MAPGAKKKLYKFDINDMPFGVQKGSHVAHIFDEDPKKLKEFVSLNSDNYRGHSGYGDVSREEVYSNTGEKRTAEIFGKLAQMSAELFDKYQDDKDMAAFCYAVKDYITADGRAPQQKALTNLRLRFENTRAKIINRMSEIAELEEQEHTTYSYVDTLEEMYNGMNECQQLIDNQLDGNLTIDATAAKIHMINDGVEPKDVFTGKAGYWKETSDSLFPHDPTPNDIKQGLGVEDCYCLSVLTQLAAKDPDYIKNMLRDNGDNTVTVRFFTRNSKNQPEPVYVTVNKTVSKTVFGQDNYANSSLWVQMVEKAYAKYNAEFGAFDPQEADLEKNQKGMGSMWRGTSNTFMNAIFSDEHVYMFGPMAYNTRLYEKDAGGNFVNHPDYYVPEEEEYFQILDKYINNEKAVVTTMPDKESFVLGKSPHDVGLRNGHVYTIRGVFEQDGKKFVQLRDPYGTFTTGYDKNGKLVNKSDVFDVLKSTVKSGGETMGTFNMEFKDYLKYFNVIQGMPEEMGKEITKLQEKERDYNLDPLTPEEMDSRDNYDFNTYKERKALRVATDSLSMKEKLDYLEKEKSINESNARLKETLEESLAERDLNEAVSLVTDNDKLQEFANQIKEAYDDLKATDEFYILTNTKQFRDMRDSLKELNNNLKKLQDGKELDPQKLADSIKKVRTTSSDYTDVKAISIGKYFGLKDNSEENAYLQKHKRLPKQKTVPDRALHRFASAVSINNICSYQKPLNAWPGKAQEALSIYRSDIEQRLAMAKEGKQVEGNNIPEWKLEKLHSDIVKMQEKSEFHISGKEQKESIDKAREESKLQSTEAKQL